MILALAALLVGCGADPAIDDAFLWRVDGAQKPTFLLGTIHVGVEADELPLAVWDAFDRSSVFVAESDVTEALSEEELRQAMQLPPNVTLDQLLDPEVWLQLQDLLADVPQEQLRQIHPWILQSVIQQGLLPDQPAMDETFTRQARGAGKSVEFFESFADFSATIDDIPVQQSAESLEAMVRDPRGFIAAIDRLVDLYRGGDERTVRLALYGDAEDPQGSASDQSLLKGRNEAWFPALQRLVRSGGAFVAVGLAHLIGPDNLIDMLAEQGLRAVRIGLDSYVSSRAGGSVGAFSVAQSRRLLRMIE